MYPATPPSRSIMTTRTKRNKGLNNALLVEIITTLFLSSSLVVSSQEGALILNSGEVQYPTSFSRLSVEGKYIRDEYGRVRSLRGVEYTAPWHYKPQTPHFSDLATLKNYGVNSVRLAWSWRHLEDKEGLYNVTYLEEYVDPTMSWCEQLEIYVILDLHTWNWNGNSSEQSGIPMWVTKSGLWTDTQVQQSWFNAWAFVLGRYRNNKALAAFDPLAEMNLDGTGLRWNQTHWNSLLDEIARYERRITPNIILWAELTPWGEVEPWKDYWKSMLASGPLNSENSVCSVHAYDAQVLGNWNHERVVTINEWINLFSGILDLRDSSNITVHVSEFGSLQGMSDQQFTNAAQSYKNLLSLLEQNEIGWFYYAYVVGGQTMGTREILLLQDYL